MKCSKCGSELIPGAQFCDICGATVVNETYEEREAREAEERAYDKKKRIIKAVVIAVVAIVALYKILQLIWPADIFYDPDLYGKLNRVTAEEYLTLSEGLSFNQVRRRLGRGYKYSRYGNVFIGGEHTYVWPGKYIERRLMYSEVMIRFDNRTNKVTAYSENNVIDGKEIYENLSNGRKAITKRTKEEIGALRDGQTYEEIAAFLGIEGILINSKSSSDGNDEKTYEWHYYGDDYDKAKITMTFFKGKASDIQIN